MRSLVHGAVRLPVRPISRLVTMLIAAEVVLGAATAAVQTFSNATPITIQ